MKKSLFLCVFLYGIGITSCSDELEVQEEAKVLPTVREIVAYPKSGECRSRSGQLNWEEWEKVTLSSGNPVNTPWNTIQSTTAIPYDIRMDIKAVDGWELIAHTVNGYGELGVNYLIFHNKYTGVLKGFYYLEPGQAALQNTAMWKLHFEVPQSCLAFSDVYAELSTKKDVYDIYVGNISNDDSKGYTVGWNCFQTELAYDPDLKEGTLQIIPHSCTTSTIELDGDFESTTEGVILSTTTYNEGDEIVKSVAKYAGNKAEKWVEKAIESEKVFKEIKSLVVKGAGSLVSSGVSTLLGAFTGGFDKEKNTVQTVMLQTNGKVTLSGEIKTLATGLVNPFTLSLSPEKIGRLGVWSLSDYPCLRLSPYATHYKQDNDEAVQIYQSTGPEFYASDLEDRLNLNPEMLSSVKSYTVKGEIYETSHIVLYDALNEGTSGVHNERRPVSSELLYDEVYRPPFYIYTGVVLKDKNGEELWDWGDKAPFEIYLPNTPEGEQGAVPHLTFMSRYILVVTVEMEVENEGRENTIVSSHTFVPRFRWDYYNSGDWYYNVYPFVPIEN